MSKLRGREPRRLIAVFVAAVLATIAVTALLSDDGPSPAAPTVPSASIPQTLRDQQQDSKISGVNDRVSDLHGTVELVLVPISILVGILALGGVLGVVFSIRDQSRASQLHELSMTSGMAAERRADQSFTSFFEASQKTLTLVNDTLAVAKEASDRAAHTMRSKASSSLETVEGKAQELVLRIAETQDYEEIIDVPEYRTAVERIAQELQSLDGYLRLQEIPVGPYCRFVRGVERYLDDDAGGALSAFRDVSQLAGYPQLERFAYYLLAQLHAGLGEYDKASSAYRDAGTGIQEDTSARLELDRALKEVEYLKIAASSRAKSPYERFAEIGPLLEDLEKLLASAQPMLASSQDHRIVHQIAVTLANAYTWVAHDHVQSHRPLQIGAIKDAGKLRTGKKRIVGSEVTAASERLAALPRETLRAWAILQARAAYPKDKLHLDEGVDFVLRFGMAECDYWLHHEKRDIKEYREVEHAAVEGDQTAHREHRKLVEVAQIAFVCKVRLLHHYRETSKRDVATAEGGVSTSYVKLHEELNRAKEEQMTFFSQLQRRNLTRSEFAEEAAQLLDRTLQRDRGKR